MSLAGFIAVSGCTMSNRFQDFRWESCKKGQGRIVLLDLPAVRPRERQACFVRAFSVVLEYWDYAIPDSVLAESFPCREECTLAELDTAAKKLRLDHAVVRVDGATLRAFIDAGTPVILLMKKGGKGHFAAVVGYFEHGLVVLDELRPRCIGEPDRVESRYGFVLFPPDYLSSITKETG